MKDKICVNCNKPITKKEKQIQIITRDNEIIIGDENFHWRCWLDYFLKCVKQKMERAKDKAFSIVEKIAERLGVKKIIDESIKENEVIEVVN